jgi:hypothetical protein
MDGANTLGTGNLNASSVATFSTTSLVAGGHTITAQYGGTTQFGASTSTSLTQTVNPATLTVTADPKSKVYGAALPALTFAASGFVNGDTAGTALTGALATTATTASGVGGYPITQGSLAAANYTLAFTGNTLTVTPAPLTVTANAATKVYGAALPALTFAASGLVNGDTAGTALTGALATTATAASGVATYPITQGTLAAANYTITFTGNTLTVTPAPLTVTANAATKVYGAALPALTDTASGFVNGDTAAMVLSGLLATTATAASGVGGYPITQGTLAANANYTLAFTGNTLTVTPAPLTVTANAATKVYGAALPALTFAASGFVNGDTAGTALTGALATTATAASGAGSYPITQGTLAANANYTLAFTGNTLTVTPAALMVTADPQTMQAGTAVPPLTDSVAGLVNGDAAGSVLSGSLATTATSSSPAGSYPITQGTLAANANYTLAFTGANLTVTSPPPPPPILVGFPQFSVAAGAGGPATVRFFNPDGSPRFDTNVFSGFTGGVRVTSADFNGDGVADIVAGTGPGGPSHVVILDGKDHHQLFSVDPFEAAFVGGVYVASGDVTGDGVPDLVISPDEGGGPRVQVYSGAGFVKTADFFGIDDPNFRGGARTAISDINGDGIGDLIVAAGFGGGPRVAGYVGGALGSGHLVRAFNDFFAFEQTLRNGVFIAGGDLNGDGIAEVIAGGGPGGGPRVTAFDGAALVKNQYVPDLNFFAGNPDNRGGVRLVARNLDGDNMADLVVGDGTGAGSHVTGYRGKDLLADGGNAHPAFSFDAFPGFTGGVYVG